MERAVFVYDGDCAFCTRCVEFYRRHAVARAAVIPWQAADLDALGLTAQQCDSAVQWVEPGREAKAGPDAIARLLRTSTGYLGLVKLAGLLLGAPGVRLLARPVYRWVARNRHRLPGGTPACELSSN
ncbi:MAG: thiol-disulfide oxidoreductase DCC family protein [Stackebrandtia sp.]